MVPCALASLAPSLEVTEEVRREQKGRERPGNFHGCGKTRPGPVPFSCALRPKVVAATVGAGVPGPHSNEQSPPLSQPPLGPPQPAPLRPSDRNSHPSPTLRPPFWSTGGSPLLFHSRKLNTPPKPFRPARLTRHTGFPHPLPSSAALPFLPPGQGSPPHLPGQAWCLPWQPGPPSAFLTRSLPSDLLPCLPPQARALAPALTELGDVPGHRVVLLAPVQRGRRGTPVALAVRGRSHSARCRRRRRRPDAPPLAALGSAGSQAGSGPARALTACPSRTPSPRGGAGAVSSSARRGNPAHRRRQAARALPAPRPPRGRWGFPPPPASQGRAVVWAPGQWFPGLPAPLRHAPGCMFGAPDNPEAVPCLDVSEPLSLSVCVCGLSFN